MYLKSLDITGFKSFPEKTQIKFSPGITATIGPNGCGKSNLVDAIRWALGEQSAKLLRGSKMDDLIFNGTAERRALNFAEVSLTFDRADECLPTEYREILLTRRMYRSGEGEYYLNKTLCRLKDITELFLDTGIGKEAYSMIGQGRVEHLINARPEENRELFEEASEIHKYKQRKKEATAKLEEMNKNLLRVEDLLAELKNQSLPLSEAASLARKHRELSLDLKKIEKSILLERRRKNCILLQKANGELGRLHDIIQGKKSNLNEFGERTSILRQREDLKLAEINEIKEHFQDQREEMEKMRGRLNLVYEQKKYSHEKNLSKDESCREVLGHISGLEETTAKNRAELESVILEQKQLGEKVASLKAEGEELQNKGSLTTLDELRQQEIEKNLQKAALGQLLESSRLQYRELCGRIKENAGHGETKKSELDLLQKGENDTLSLLQEVKREDLDLHKGRELLEQRRKEFLDQRKIRKDELVYLEREWQKKNARLKYLQESEDDLTLYARGVRAVMNKYAGNSLEKGIFGPVANLISVPPEFERALEVALGAKIQFIVTSDDISAQKAIEFLKEKKAGRATFLPLTIIKAAAVRKFPHSEHDDLYGVASRLVETPEKFKTVIEYLLGGVLVARNLETALKLASGNRAGWKIVTLDGEMITPGGAISGGYQSDERSGFLLRKRELKNLEIEIREIQKVIKQKNRELEAIGKNLTELEEDFTGLDLKGRKLEDRKNKIQTNLAGIEAEKGRVQKEITHLTLEEAELYKKRRDLEEQISKAEKDDILLNQSLEAINIELETVSRQAEIDEKHFKSLEKELVEARIRLSALQEKESSLEEVLDKQLQEKERQGKIYARLVKEKEKLQEELKELSTEADLTAKKLEDLRKSSQELENFREGLIADLNCCQREKEELSMEVEKEQKALERAERRQQNINFELIKLQEAEKYLEESLLEKFNLDPREIPSPSPFFEPEETLLKDKELLEEKIRLLGEVDLGAIDEYERLQNRVSFLEVQRDDLLSGGKGIIKVLQELDQHMEIKFRHALHAIGKNFMDVFAQLFGGGQALLEPTDPDNILESGIEIIAQPPGKKLQNISLLSGGEKALTAIALLFAVLKYKPAPFCVLDEIDSSLDESNLSKYVDFLKQYAPDTQFIIITHRRKTMEGADVLYGVTMEEQGVSKVVSLDLNQKAG